MVTALPTSEPAVGPAVLDCVLLDCPECADVRLFECPPCGDGHEPCPEVICVEKA